MKSIGLIILTVLSIFLLGGCQKLWYVYLNNAVDIAPDRFTVEEKNQLVSLPIFTSRRLTTFNEDSEYLIILIHGGGLNAEKSLIAGERFAESLGIHKRQSVIVAPQFLEGVDADEKDLLVWNRTWRSGGWSGKQDKGQPEINSYEILDRLLYSILESHPNIHSTVMMGHSAGGQFVLRYAAVNNHHESFEKQGMSIRYVVVNPSSYVYLDGTRYHLDQEGKAKKTSQAILADCPAYNNYKYGLDHLFGYAEAFSAEIIRSRLLKRPVLFLLGKADTKRGWSLDKSCEAESQGRNRYERGILYKYHLSDYLQKNTTSNHIWIEIKDVGHNALDMYSHPYFIQKMTEILVM